MLFATVVGLEAGDRLSVDSMHTRVGGLLRESQL